MCEVQVNLVGLIFLGSSWVHFSQSAGGVLLDILSLKRFFSNLTGEK